MEILSRSTCPMPLLPGEALLPQVEAEPWLKIDDGDVFLKGIAFDRDDNLLLMTAPLGNIDKSMAGRLNRSILSISPEKAIRTLINHPTARMCDHAVHQDGRILIACLSGELLVANPDGSGLRPIESRCQDKPVKLSDLTFDSRGYLYVTDFTGRPGSPTGGVYRWAPDFQSVESLLPNLITPNGIAFAPDDKSFWVSCSLANEVIYATLSGDRNSVEKAAVQYRLCGPAGGDGIRVDVQGNMYLAVNFQGRVLILNQYGIPVAHVLMPGRDRGELMQTTNVVFRPGLKRGLYRRVRQAWRRMDLQISGTRRGADAVFP